MDYAEASKRNDHVRGEGLKTTLHWVALIMTVVIGTILISGVSTWAWHVLTPIHRHWLSPAQLSDIQQTMSSALLAVMLSNYSRKYFG